MTRYHRYLPISCEVSSDYACMHVCMYACFDAFICMRPERASRAVDPKLGSCKCGALGLQSRFGCSTLGPFAEVFKVQGFTVSATTL